MTFSALRTASHGPFTLYLHGISIPFPLLFWCLSVTVAFMEPPDKNQEGACFRNVHDPPSYHLLKYEQPIQDRVRYGVLFHKLVPRQLSVCQTVLKT